MPRPARGLRSSVEYWRRFVPEDGLELAELAGRLEKESEQASDR